jgi:DNA-directed RNA polymerase subunit H (RpoH/RPB5)
MSLVHAYGFVQKLYNSRKHLLNQLKKQGYNTDNYNNFTINEINILFTKQQQDMLLTNDKNQKLYIKYYVDKTIRPQQIHDMIEDLYHLEEILKKDDILFIITKDPPNDTIKKLLVQLFATEDIFISILSLSQLQFNILNHSMVPKHKELTNDEKQVIDKKYNLRTDHDYPTISRFDPVALIIGLKPNRLCEIIRKSPTAINGYYYRLCVNK